MDDCESHSFHLVGYHVSRTNFCPHHVSHKNTLPNSGNFSYVIAQLVRESKLFCNVFVFTEDAHVFSWGRADYGQLGVGDDVVQQGFCSEPIEIRHIRGAKQVFK